MTYKEEIIAANTRLAADPATVFVGYGIKFGRAGGTIKTENADQLLETTLAEHLMVGMAIGLSLAGRKPVVYVERADFLWKAADQIVNHLDVMATLSRGQFRPAVILRVAVGKKTKPLFTGITHTRDCSAAFKAALNMEVINLRSDVAQGYALAAERQARGESTMLFEYLDIQ